MVVRDVTDFCFHSYFSFMDELSENMGEDEEPFDIKYVLVTNHTIGLPQAYVPYIVMSYERRNGY
jgi:hypothetical protein